MTHEEALSMALDALGRIAQGAHAMHVVEEGDLPSNKVMRETLIGRSMSLPEIEKLALDTWETVLTEVTPRLPGTTVFECSPSETDTSGTEPKP